jgi:hypothetical protein
MNISICPSFSLLVELSPPSLVDPWGTSTGPSTKAGAPTGQRLVLDSIAVDLGKQIHFLRLLHLLKDMLRAKLVVYSSETSGVWKGLYSREIVD